MGLNGFKTIVFQLNKAKLCNLYMIDKIFAGFNNTLCRPESFSRAKELKGVICIVSEQNWISYQVYRFSIRENLL